MLISLISRQSQTHQHHSLSLSLLLRHLNTTPSTSSKLHTKYSFVSPPSIHPQNPNPNPNPKPPTKKPPYSPPSSLETGKKPLRSTLPFDFRYSYTESNPSVKPIGLREPKYSPFGPGRLDREWTGVCAPAKSPKVTSVDEPPVEDPKLEEKRRLVREKLLGKPLTDAERKILVDNCQKTKTKR